MQPKHSFLTLTAGLSVASFTALAAAPASDQNWPQWRGPTGNGVALTGNPPTEWSETKNVKWKTKVSGEGFSTPIIWGNQIFIQSAVGTGKKVENAGANNAPPDRPPGGKGGPGGAPPAAPGGPGNFSREEMLARYDKNKDGQLDETERETMRTDMQQRFGGPGGPGGKGGPPGGPGGPGGKGFGGKGGPGGGRGGFGGQTPSEEHRFVLQSYDRQTGKLLWEQSPKTELPHEGHHQTSTFASASPVTDGKRVIAFFGSRGLHCYDMGGKLQWSVDFGKMRTRNAFGEGSSPTLYGNTLIVNWDHEGEDFITALDANTGKTLWKTARNELTSWATPVVVEVGGKPQVIINATAKIRSYDLATGKQVWECGGATENVIPTPVVGHGMIYITSGYRGNSLQAIKLGRTGDLTDTDAIAWKHGKSTPYVPSPLLVGEQIYFHSGNNAMLSCFNAKTGKPLFEAERLTGFNGVYASPVAAGGKVYLTGREGTVVLKQSDKLEVLATNKLDDRFDASPAIVGNEMFLRGHQYLYCLAEK
jgi:outer membrane protein assembly factor BamB